MKTCPRCLGDGKFKYIKNRKPMTCMRCMGKGEVAKKKIHVV